MKLHLQFSTLACILASLLLATAAGAARKGPFTGDWISLQYTNGREFLLKLEQVDHDLIGWEGKLPPDLENLQPDLKGTINGKVADVEVQHRRGYQAHALLRLQGHKLVWQLLESDNRSSRYFPLASTLNRYEEDRAASAPLDSAKGKSSAGSSQAPGATAGADQALWGILQSAGSLDADAGSSPADASPYFAAYKALLKTNLNCGNSTLKALLSSDKPAARLYAAAIMWELDETQGKEAFRSLASDQSYVQYRVAGKVSSITVSEIAESFLSKGGYPGFPSKVY